MPDVNVSDIASGRVACNFQDFVDLQTAIAGLDVGRIPKFLSPEDTKTLVGRRRKEERERIHRTLQDLLLNEIYANAHDAANTVIKETFRFADDVLQRLLEQREEIAQAITNALKDAPMLPDGRKVFRDANGLVWDENIEFVEPEIAAGVQWTGNEPSYEYYQSLLQAEAKTTIAIQRAQGLQAQLGDLHTELNHDDAPPTLGEIEEIEGHAQDIKNQLEELQTMNAPIHSAISTEPQSQVFALNEALSTSVPLTLN